MPIDRRTRLLEARRAIVIVLIITGSLAVVQAVVGYLGNSAALLALSVHFGMDLLTGIAVYYAVSVATRAPDVMHPYGHGKAEPVVALAIGTLLLYAGVEIVTEAIRSLFIPAIQPPGISALVLAGAGVVSKEALYRYQHEVGTRLNSEALLASARDSRADELASLASLIGIGLARLGYPKLDPIAAIVVGVLILRAAYDVGSESVRGLMDRPASPEIERRIKEIAESVPGVDEAFSIRTRQSGPLILADLGVHVDENLTLRQGHEIAVEVRRRILHSIEGIVEVLVHIHVGPHEEFVPTSDIPYL